MRGVRGREQGQTFNEHHIPAEPRNVQGTFLEHKAISTLRLHLWTCNESVQSADKRVFMQ